MLMSKTDYARHKGISRQTVYDWIAKGDLVLMGSKIDVEASEHKLKGSQPVHPWHDPDKKLMISPRAAVYSKDEDLSDIRYQPFTLTAQEAADMVRVLDDVYPPADSEDELRERVLDAVEALGLEVRTVDIDGDDEHIIGIEFYDPEQGKVTAIALLLAGEHNTASGSMSSLDSARGRAQFVGKKLIIMPDQTRYVGEGAGIKAITGGDPVEIDGKYEKQFTTVIHAVVVATNNEPMTFTERNGGIARRRVIFPFNQTVSDAGKDPDLMAKIRPEMPVIIRCLLSVFADQNRAKALLTEQRGSEEAMGVKRHTDPLYGFCEHIVALGEAVGMLMGNLNISPRAPRIYLY